MEAKLITTNDSSETTFPETFHTAGFSSFQNFNHKCDKCGHGENYDKMYPILEYIDDGELG